MERKLVALIIGAMIAVLCSAFAAQPLFRPEGEEFWNGQAAVIVARIVAVRNAVDSAVYFEAEVEPLACVAGLFNPAMHARVRVDFSAGSNSALRVPPKADDLVLAVVVDRAKLGAERPGFGLANGRCSFMPDERPLIVVKGMNDPVILDVLRRMQGSRAPATAPDAQR